MGMGDWKKWLADFDDDYLIGIANKGIVKRAYKDKEDGNYRVLSAEEEAEVSVGGETVRIRVPLSESTCSCPSRTVCRHVVLGVLALREYGEEKTGGDGQGLSEEEGEFQEEGKEGGFRKGEGKESFRKRERKGNFGKGNGKTGKARGAGRNFRKQGRKRHRRRFAQGGRRSFWRK